MTVINGTDLLKWAPIKNMLPNKVREHGVSHGLAEAGYDIRLKQDLKFYPAPPQQYMVGPMVFRDGEVILGRFTITSAIEEFDMPHNMVGIVHDKSSWARKGLSVFNTVIEPGWKGFLTLELVFHGNEILEIPAGAGIAQVLFHELSHHAEYTGKYQNQEDKPVESIHHD